MLAAFVNAVSLVVLALFLFYESYERLRNPQPVSESTMIAVAAIGLALNLFIVWRLGGHGADMNIRAAWIRADQRRDELRRNHHWCGRDSLHGMAENRSGAVDSLISLMIIWSGWGIIQDSLNVLLEASPKGIALEEVTGGMRGVEEVIDVDLHIWSLGSQARAELCHVLIDDVPPSASEAILRNIKGVAAVVFDQQTDHQFEHVRCEDPCDGQGKHNR